MLAPGTTANIASEMSKYQLDLVGVTESRWPGSGRIKLTTGETISILKEAKTINKTWEELKKDAQNRVSWRSLVAALCSLRNEEDK